MPELPEVELQVRQLRPYWSGQRICQSIIRDAKLRALEHLRGERMAAVTRRGKNIVVHLASGEYLLIHLRMTGWFERQEPARWRWAVRTGRGWVYLEDPRRLATVRRVDSLDPIHGLGVEPLTNGWDPAIWRKGRQPIKQVLLNQRLVAGIGNIYACEALWRAGIDPRRPSAGLTAGELMRLQRAVRTALREAVALGPRIFTAQTFAVYRRGGQRCRRCGTRIVRTVLAQRGTYWCPRCQH